MDAFLNQNMTVGIFSLYVVFAAVMLVLVLGYVTYAIYFLRKVAGWIQLRHGPTRVGPFGLLQTVADVVKLLIKEDTIPKKADRDLFILAPVLAFVPAFTVLVTLPYSEHIFFANLNVGVLFYVALSGISTIGIVLGGWASNNKYALLGGMRSAAQMISYEIPLVISVVGVIMISGTMNFHEIVARQGDWFWNWNFIPQILGFIVFVIAGVSELNQTPFDLPEAESELVAGYFVEYSGFRWAFFMLTEFVYSFGFAALTTDMFLGGWHAPFPFLNFIPGIIWFLIKFVLVVFFLFWLRATLPRIRVDQLMSIGWKWLLPLSLVNVFITALYMELVK